MKQSVGLTPISMPEFKPIWQDVEGDWCKNETLFSVEMSPLERRIAEERPSLSASLGKLRSLLGDKKYQSLIDPIHNLTKREKILLVVAGNFLQKSLLERECIPYIKEAFDVSSVRIVA